MNMPTTSIANSKPMYSKAFKNGISVLLHCLNNEDDVGSVLETIIANDHKADQIIVVDGGSRDKTIEIAKNYTREVYVTDKGFANQQKVGLSKVKHKYLLIIENDHRYPPDFIANLSSELRNSDFDGIQATLVCDRTFNYFEKGISVFYEIHLTKKGKKDIISGPALYYTRKYVENIDHGKHNGFSIDTNRAEVFSERGIKMGLGYTIAFHHQRMNLYKFIRKHFNYGCGDYDFYSNYTKKWNTRRRVKSIFHVFNRYIIIYPLKTIKIGKLQYIPYFWMSAFFRYSGWFFAILRNKCNI